MGAYVTIDDRYINAKGVVGVRYDQPMTPGKKYKVYTYKVGSPEYHYNIAGNMDWFPLQHGNGVYSIRIYKQDVDTRYICQESYSVTLNMEDPCGVFLASNFYMEWDNSMAPIQHAFKLCEGITDDQGKTEAIWKFITSEFSYDFKLAKAIADAGGKYNYTPGIVDIFLKREGICFGLVALFNAMLRSQGVPAKMVHGYVMDVYHAWSEVWIEDWVLVDPTTGLNTVTPFSFSCIEPRLYQTKFIY